MKTFLKDFFRCRNLAANRPAVAGAVEPNLPIVLTDHRKTIGMDLRLSMVSIVLANHSYGGGHHRNGVRPADCDGVP